MFCNAVAIGSGIFQFTQAQVNVFVLTAFEYSYLAFTSLVIVVELCTLLCYDVIVLKFQSLFNFCLPVCSPELKVGAVNHFNFTFLHSISLFCTQFHLFALNFTFCTDLGLIDMLLTNQNAEIVACILLLPELYDTRSNY